MFLSTSRARGELLCASTKSARDFSFGDAVPSSSFSSIGIACSGSAFSSALIARIFSSSSLSLSGLHRLAAVAANLRLELLRLLQVAALGIVLRERRDRRQRFGALSRPVLRPRLPVERGVGARAPSAR